MSLYDDLFSQMTGISPDDTCMTLVRQALAPWDAGIDDVNDNWHTTGFYTPEQMQQINQLVTDLIETCAGALSDASGQMQLEGHREMIDAATKNLRDRLIDPTPFRDAVREAASKGIKIIEAQGFKRHIVNVLKAARVAKLTTQFVACARPVLFDVLSAMNRAGEALIAFVKAVGTVIKKVGETVLEVFDWVGTLFRVLGYLPWIALAFGGYYVATKTVLPPKYDPLKLRERETFRPWRRKLQLTGRRK